MALHNRRVCRFLSHLVTVTVPHVHSFHNFSPGTFSKHNGCSLNVGRRVMFPRMSFSGVSHVHNVSMAVAASTRSSRRNHTLLGTFNFPFGWNGSIVTGGDVVGHRLGHRGVITGCTRGHVGLGRAVDSVATDSRAHVRTVLRLRTLPHGSSPMHLHGHYTVANHPRNCFHGFNLSHGVLHRHIVRNSIPNIHGTD